MVDKYKSLKEETPYQYGSKAVAGLIKHAKPGADVLLGDNNHSNTDVRRVAFSPEVDRALSHDHHVTQKYIEMPVGFQSAADDLYEAPTTNRNVFMRTMNSNFKSYHANVVTTNSITAEAVTSAQAHGISIKFIDTIDSDDMDGCVKEKIHSLGESGNEAMKKLDGFISQGASDASALNQYAQSMSPQDRNLAGDTYMECRIKYDANRAPLIQKMQQSALGGPISGVYGADHLSTDSRERYGSPNIRDLTEAGRDSVTIMINDGTFNGTPYDTRSQFDAVVDIRDKTTTINHPEKFPGLTPDQLKVEQSKAPVAPPPPTNAEASRTPPQAPVERAKSAPPPPPRARPPSHERYAP